MQLVWICYAANAFLPRNSYTIYADQSINSVYLLSHNSVVRDHLSPFEVITKENGSAHYKRYAYIIIIRWTKEKHRMENEIRRMSKVSVLLKSNALSNCIQFGIQTNEMQNRANQRRKKKSNQIKCSALREFGIYVWVITKDNNDMIRRGNGKHQRELLWKWIENDGNVRKKKEWKRDRVSERKRDGPTYI